MSPVVLRWRTLLAGRRGLLAYARRQAAYWRARKAKAKRGTQAYSHAGAMLHDREQKLAHRQAQVEYAERVIARHGSPSLTTVGGAQGLVDSAFALARYVGGPDVYVGSGYRPYSTTSGGNRSDHASDNASQAARDIGFRGLDLLVGPPSPRLDAAAAAIGDAFGRDYGNGKQPIIDTFNWNGYRIQVIWRTPAYGGHMGHVHIGARRL